MKTLHRIDFPAQIVILVLSFGGLFFQPYFLFFGIYFGIGAWQLIMAIVFALGPRPHQIRGRHHYEKALLVVGILGLPCLIPIDQSETYRFCYLMLLMFGGGAMALWNLAISKSEYDLAKSQHQVWDIE